MRQRSKTLGQRGLKAQPGGMAERRGMAPGIWARREARPSKRRDRRHQPFRVRVERIAHDLADLADLGDAPGIHHRHPVRRLGDHAHVMGDEHHRRAMLARQALQHRDDLRLNRDVERGRRLVGDDERGFGAKRERDHHALAHAARELVRIVVDPLLGRRDADLGETARSPARAPASG